MKILYVVSRPLEINTSASIRNRATILGFLENGHTVDLFTTEPDKNHNAYDENLAPKGIKVKYAHLGGTQNLARVGRKLKILKPIKGIVYKWMNRNEVYDNLKGIINHINDIDLKTEKYDVIVSSSDPKSSHLFVERLLEKENDSFEGRWIQIWGDPFFGDITSKNNKKAELIKKEERRLLSKANKVIYVSKLTKEKQKCLYPESADKMIHIAIPYMKKEFYNLREIGNMTRMKLVYCGDYNSSVRNILPLYNAVNDLENVHLTICGGSDIRLESTEKVTVYGRVSYEKVKQLEKEADVLVHLSNLSGTQIPGKIYQYSGTNKPILFILDGEKQELRNVFERYNRYVFSNNNVENICSILKEGCNDGQEINQEPVEEFSPRFIASKILG